MNTAFFNRSSRRKGHCIDICASVYCVCVCAYWCVDVMATGTRCDGKYCMTALDYMLWRKEGWEAVRRKRGRGWLSSERENWREEGGRERWRKEVRNQDNTPPGTHVHACIYTPSWWFVCSKSPLMSHYRVHICQLAPIVWHRSERENHLQECQ